MMKFLDAKTVFQKTDYLKLIEIMKQALKDIFQKESIVPQRIHLNYKEKNSTFLFMPVLSSKLKKVCFKYVGVCPENKEKNMPVINGFVFLADINTGIPEIFIDGASLTAVRTGAVGGAAIDILSHKNSKIAAVFGTGPQAETQIKAMISIRKIKKIFLFYRNLEKAKNFIKKFKNIEFNLDNDISNLSHADIIITATDSKTPLFNVEVKFKKHVHINAIGSFKPDMQEIHEKVYEKFEIFTDSKQSCIKESGDIIIPLQKGLISDEKIRELGEIIDSKNLQNTPTIFKSVGNAVFDLYTANYFYQSFVP